MPYTSIIEYLAARGHEPERQIGRQFRYYCPLHQEMTSSFDVDPEKNVWICRGGCDTGGGLTQLIMQLESVSKKQAYDIQYGEECNKERLQREYPRVSPLPRPKKAYASEGQRHVLTLLARFWHYCLHQESYRAHAAYHYLQSRGIANRILRLPHFIGYSPYDPNGEYAQALCTFIEKHAGKEGPRIAFELGVLDKERKLRIRNRVTFHCYGPDKQVWYYHARIVPPAESDYKYLGPTNIAKYPFIIPVERPVLQATIGVEAPIGSAVLASHDFLNVATLGNGLPNECLSLLPAPFLWAQDHDAPKPVLDKEKRQRVQKETGVPLFIRPGERQAEKCIKLCQEQGIPSIRLRPPREGDGVDEWIYRLVVEERSGSGDPLTPFMDEIVKVFEQHGLSIPRTPVVLL